MVIDSIEREFREKVSSKVRLYSEGMDRYRVFTPFVFDDGDHLSIVLRRERSGWLLSDEGHTYMHLTYDIDEKSLQSGTRQKVISNTLSMFRIEDQEGELLFRVENERYGDALYSFAQALMKVTDISYLSRERVRSTFMEDFRALISHVVPEERRTFDWFDEERDPKGNYVVDCHVNGMPRPLLIHALPSNNRTRDATITLLQFEKWGRSFRSLAIFEDQESINRKVLARFSDVSEKQYSNLSPDNKTRISRYINDVIQR